MKNIKLSYPAYSIIGSMLLGFTLGIIAKLLDENVRYFSLFFLGYIGGQLSIWIVIASLLTVYSKTPLIASMKVFFFFMSMLVAYYTYTVLFLGFNPKSQIIFWGICGLISPLCAYILWQTKKTEKLSILITALPVSLILVEFYLLPSIGEIMFELGEHSITLTHLIYIIFAFILAGLIPTNKKYCIPVIVLSLFLSYFLYKIELIRLIFDGYYTF